MDYLLQLDHFWFKAINQGLSNPIFDVLMPLIRNRFTWVPLYLIAAYLALKKYGKAGGFVLLFGLLCFALADFTSASLMKPWVARLRPCNTPGLTVYSLIPCGTGFSFPSSHAANHFALAVFFATLFSGKFKWAIILPLFWAFSIAFAQVYVGVHFPIDVFVGAILGSMVGFGMGVIFSRLNDKMQWNFGK